MKPNALTFAKIALLSVALLSVLPPVVAQEKFVYPSYPKPGEPKRDNIDNSRRIVPSPAKDYWPFSGISGPGAPVTDETARGGWVSGLGNIKYKGPVPRLYPTAPWKDDDSGSAVAKGLMPALRPIWDVHMRDTIICLGGDGNYYMTGTTGDNCWALNDGIELYTSTDLKTWRYLGLVWSIERDGTWEKNWTMRMGVPFRTIWAPEIHFIGGNYYICYCISGVGMGFLKSTSGKAEGPYGHVLQETPIRGGIDSTLFEEDDGRVYLTYGPAAKIREIKRDFSAFAGDWQPIEYDMPPRVSNPPRPGQDSKPGVGFEGATLFKANGRYYLGCCDFFEGRYSFMFGTSDKLLGPYRGRHEGPSGGGGGNVFRDKTGQWWQTYFGNDKQMPFREKPGLAAIAFDADGKVILLKNQPFASKAWKP
jgi:xylan 1,4-beta-xylosidase